MDGRERATGGDLVVEAVDVEEDGHRYGGGAERRNGDRGRKAFQEAAPDEEKERWLERPFWGVDAVPKTGQTWLRNGLLTATIFTPPNAVRAIELLNEAFRTGRMPAERVLIPPSSMPAVEVLRPRE